MAETHEPQHFLDYWRVIRARKEIVIAVSLLVIVTGILITFSLPKVYMSSAVILVKQDTPDVRVFPTESVRFDPWFLRTQFEIIQSRPIVEEVVRTLNLTEKLGRAHGYLEVLGEKSFDHTVKLISRAMRVHQYRDTNLIEIQVYLSEPKESAPEEAARIANAIAEVFRQQNARKTRDTQENALKAMQESIEEQRKLVEEKKRKVASVREKYQLDILGSDDKTAADLSEMTLARLDAERVRIRMEYESKKALYEKVMSLGPEELRASGAYLVNDMALAALVAEKRKAEVEKERLLKSELGPRHPDVLKVQASIEEIDRKVQDAIEGLKAGVQAGYETAKAQLLAIESMIEAQKASVRHAGSVAKAEYADAVAERDHAQKVLDELELAYREKKIEQRLPRTTVEVVSPAKAPDVNDYVRPNILLNVLLSIVLGLGTGIGLAYFVEYLDTSVKTIEDVERYMELPVLGVIPQKVRPLIEKGAPSAHAEAYRLLRTNIQFSKTLRGAKTICITSGSVGEGKSLTLFNLAYVCAQLGDRVLIVDSDLHRPRQHKMLGVSNSIGLATILMGKIPLEEAIIRTQVPNLSLLPSGRMASGSHGLLATRSMSDLVARVREMYDLVLFDSPPMIGVSDTSMLVREVEGVLLIIQHRKYPRAVSTRAKDMIENVGGRIIGVVLNNINISRDHTYYYYQHHYYYYPRRTTTEVVAKG
ncbi:MAG: polysaccharide biosynthesis tyrosine autokinase [Kiritimatiellae bacterium]|nr:polysaccharide biosynthesis tyrosine autokinase [Kiritimatiellia bacterium]